MCLKDKLRQVYSEGFNIYQYINAFKKESKLREDLPEEIYIKTCQDFLRLRHKIKKPYPYFKRMIKTNSASYFASKEQVNNETVNTNLLERLGL